MVELVKQLKKSSGISYNLYIILILVAAFTLGIYFIYFDSEQLFDKYPSTMSFYTEFAAGSIGVFLGFAMERRSKYNLEKEYSQQVISNILQELMTNKKQLNDFKASKNKGRFVLLLTSSWDMFKEKIVFDEMNHYITLGTIYHSFDEFNSNMRYCGTLGQAESRMEPNSTDFYDNLIRMIDDFVDVFEKHI